MFEFFKKKPPPPNYKNEFIKELSPPDPDDLLWTTKDGQKMLISEMKDSHLQNAHAMLTKKLIVWAAMEVELQKRKLPPKEVVFNFVPRPNYDSFFQNWMDVDEEVMF